MKHWLTVALLLSSPGLLAQEAVVTLRSTVSGNQEQPRVMYILPWQQPGEAEFDYRLRGGIADELFVPVDRDEFVRGLEYQAMIEAAGDDPAMNE
jgi:hypothetical protein